MTTLASQLVSQLDPLFEQVINTLDANDNAYPIAFFTLLRIQLNNAQAEVDLLQMFFDLSTTAFQGFVFSTAEAETVDQLLATCERISQTMTAGDHSQH